MSGENTESASDAFDAQSSDAGEGKQKNPSHISVSERLYGDALQRAESKKAIEKQRETAKEVFTPDLSPTAGYNKLHHDSAKQGSITERLYEAALRRAEHTKVGNEAKRKGALDAPFAPDLSDSADYRQKHPVSQEKPVSERLYADALYRRDESRRHEDELKEKPRSGENKKKEHIHPFATDTDPKAEYCRRMDTSLSVDGGSVEAGLYEDSSVSSASSEPITKCECGNIIQIDMDREAMIHPSAAYGGEAPFSPDIKESQKVIPSPLNVQVHGKQSSSVFDRLFHDKDERERRKATQQNRMKMEEEKELTFRPKTNVRQKKMSPKNWGQRQLCDQCSMEKSKEQGGAEEERNVYEEFLESEIKLAPEETAEPPQLDPGETFAALAIKKGRGENPV